MYNKFFKRVIDLIVSGLGILILSPVLLVLIVVIKLDSPGPILFKQKRVGLHKKHFNILKFRTMRIDTPKDTPTQYSIISQLKHFEHRRLQKVWSCF